MDVAFLTANDQIADQTTTHTVNLLRVADTLRKPALAELERLEESLVAEIAKLPNDPTSNKSARLNALLAQTKASIAGAYQLIQDNQGKALGKIAEAEQAKTNQVVNAAIGAEVMSVAQTPEQLQTMASKLLLEGKFPQQWWAKQGTDLQDKFATAMRDGIHRGEGIDALVRRVRGTKEGGYNDGIMAISKANAETLVRTSVQTTANAARLLSFERNPDVIKGVQWRATLDDRTSKICAALDGLTWSLPDYKPVGHDLPFPGPIAHFNCRSVQVAVTRSWDEMSGPNAVKPPVGPPAPINDVLRKKLLAAGIPEDKVDAIVAKKQGAINGEPAPPVRFEDWLAGKSHDFQNKLLGPTRAQLWREGTIKLRDLVGKDLEPLTIPELRQMIAKGQAVQSKPPVEGQNKMNLLDRKLMQESLAAGVQQGEVMTHLVDLDTGVRVSIKGTSPSVDDLAQVQSVKRLAVIRNSLGAGDVFTPQEINLFGKLDGFAQARIVNPGGRVLTITVKPGQTFGAPAARTVNAANVALQNTKALPSAAAKLTKAIRDQGAMNVRVDPVGTITVPPGTYNQAFPQVAKPAPFFDPQKIAQAQAAEAARLQAAKMKAEADAAAQAEAAAKASEEAARQERAQIKIDDAAHKGDALSVAISELAERKAGFLNPTEILAAAQAKVEADALAKAQAAAAKAKADADAKAAKEAAEKLAAEQASAKKAAEEAARKAEKEAAAKKAAEEAAAKLEAEKKAAEAAAAKLAAEKKAKQDAAQARIDAAHAKGGALSDALAEVNAHLQVNKGLNPDQIDPERLLSAAKDKVLADQAAAAAAAAAAEAKKQQAAAAKIKAILASPDKADQDLKQVLLNINPQGTMQAAEMLEAAMVQHAAEQTAKAQAAAAKLAAQQAAAAAYKKASKNTLETYVKGESPGVAEVNGVPFGPVPPDYWQAVADAKLANEPPPPTKKALGSREFSTGVIFLEPDGSFWVYQPTDDPDTGKPFGGYNNTFSKGRAEAGISHQQNALKEAYEELGLQGEINGYLGDFKGSSTITRFYLGKRTGGQPWEFGDETAFVKRVTPEQAKKLFNVKRDRDITDALQAYLNPPPTTSTLANLVFVKTLPGSTQPSLMRDTKTGDQFVLKREPNNPGHVREEYHANQVYRTMGIAVPEQVLSEETDGPALLSKFIPNGQTYGEWSRTATAADKTALIAEMQRGFVVDALLANYDVVGTGNDNIFVTAGGPVRLDNGGALRYRAQGAPKTAFGDKVTELDTMRDAKVNSYAAGVFGSIPQTEIRRQILEVLAKRQEILDALPFDLRDIMGRRIDDLAKRLPPSSAAPTAGFYTPAQAQAVQKAKANGFSLAGDRDLIEVNGQLFWKETTSTGDVLTKAEVYLTRQGSAAVYKAIESSLKDTERSNAVGATLAAAKPAYSTPTAPTSNLAPGDNFFSAVAAAAKTVNFHLADKKFNQNTLAAGLAQKPALEALAKNGTAQQKDMAAHYLPVIQALEAAKTGNAAQIPILVPFKPAAPVAPPPVAAIPAAPVVPQFVAKQVPLTFAAKKFVNGELVQTGAVNFTMAPGGYTAGPPTYDIEVGGVTFRFIPFQQDRSSSPAYALQGRVEVLTGGEPSPATMQRVADAFKSLGVDTAPASQEYLELAYLQRGFFSMKQENSPVYLAIVNDQAASDTEKIAKLKDLAKAQGVPAKAFTSADYQPAGQSMNTTADNGHRQFYRWDLPRAQVEKDLAGHGLLHTTSRSISTVVEAIFESGGETTPTVQRLRKGVSISAGMSPTADLGTGGANYWFTRIRKLADAKGQEAFLFKIGNLARQDTITYTGDRFGTTRDEQTLATRKTTVADYKKIATARSSDESIFRHGMNLVEEIERIQVNDASERTAIIATFKKNGFAILPDGRKIEDVVVKV